MFKVTVAEVTGQRFVIGMVKIFVNPELICQLEQPGGELYSCPKISICQKRYVVRRIKDI